MNLNPQFITDNKGKKLSVILSVKEYNKLMDELEQREDIRLYDEAKKTDDGKRILFDDYLKKHNYKNGNVHHTTQQKSRKAVR